MEDKLLIEIQRIKKVMLLESGPGTILRGMVRSFTGNIDRGKILQQLRDVDALDDTTLAELSRLTGDSFFDELINKIKNLQSSGVGIDSKYFKSLEVLLENVGKKDKFEDTIEKIKTLSNPTERKQSIESFVGNFNDPELQNIFRTSLKEIDNDIHRAVNQSTLKGKVLNRGKNVSWANNEIGLPLNNVQKALLQQKYPMSLLIEDLYHWSQGLMNVFSKSLSKEDQINKLIDDVYNRLLNVVNDLEPNMKESDINKQMAKIWADVNKIRIYGKGEISVVDKNWNSDLFKMFLKSAESKGVSYEIRDALRRGYDENNPLTRPSWWENLTKNSKTAKATDEAINEFGERLSKKTGKVAYQLLNRLLGFMTTNITMTPQKIRSYVYKYGRKKAYKKLITNSLLWGKIIIPTVASIIIYLPTAIMNMFGVGDDNTKSFIEVLKNTFTRKYSNLWSEGNYGGLVYKIIKDVLWPFQMYWDDVYNWLSGLWNDTINYTGQGWDKISNLISDTWNRILKTIANWEEEGGLPKRVDDILNNKEYDNSVEGFKSFLDKEKVEIKNMSGTKDTFINDDLTFKFVVTNNSNKKGTFQIGE